MGPLDGLWHLLNFAAPAVGVALLAATIVKLVWRRELNTVPWHSLVAWCAAAGLLTLIGGLLMFGRDGKMATYGALVTVCGVALWWVGFARR